MIKINLEKATEDFKKFLLSFNSTKLDNSMSNNLILKKK